MCQLFSVKHNKKNKTKNKRSSIPILLLICLILLIFYKNSEQVTNAKDIQQGIASEIIRFHVIANSDSRQDQALKLKVKEAVVKDLKPMLENSKNNKEARKIIINQKDRIKRVALEVIKENGYFYDVTVSLGESYFPTKVYGDMTFPPGKYEALKIEIGEASGKNWWCVMYPPLCFVDVTYNIVPDKSKETLKAVLTDDEYNSIIPNKNVKVKVRFKLLDYLKNLL